MESEYDRKFEEMKKYIPFLENMITRLESTNSTSSNPRQAQLDKIKSLRDLLQDQKKRMKMENLLKCEQVLVNLYAKVEQKDTLPGSSKQVLETRTIEANKSDLNAVRCKLKSITMKDNVAETLPEIARASETEVICTLGSKEPALFQRRPNRGTVSPRQRSPTSSKNSSSKSPSKIANKRNYTRVLLSPEPSSRGWSDSKNEDKELFVRRSPRKSSRQQSPLRYYKKERKRNSKDAQKQKDLNIILKIPENSLESLNTKDIVTRIINCSDSDVDIDTLRELRSQIIGELKDTGAQDDISDLILKSYKHKKKSKKKQKGEIEEGELSDSESEAIGSIYGNLKIIEKDEIPASMNKSDNINPTERKIQISLVFNADTEPFKIKQNINDELALENYNDNIIPQGSGETSNVESYAIVEKVDKPSEITAESKEQLESNTPAVELKKSSKEPEIILDKNSIETTGTEKTEEKVDFNTTTSSGFRANFYKPLHQMETEKTNDISELQDTKIQNVTNSPHKTPSIPIAPDSDNTSTDPKSINLNSSVLSEIDILQALKNDILSESLSISGVEISTPTLHQPKIHKVENTQETITKKRISIERYKAKSVTTSQPLFVKDPQKDTKKTSLKLTEKEFERFKLDKLSVGNSSDEDIDSGPKVSNDIIYSDLVPRSPENEDKTASETPNPVIIPENPLETSKTIAQTDIDMRLLISVPAPSAPHLIPTNLIDDCSKSSPKVDEIKNKLLDPRMRRDLSRSVSKESPNAQLNTDRASRSSLPTPSYPNMTPNRTPNSISFEMTPSQQFCEDQPIRKHIYAPALSMNENSETSTTPDGGRQKWEDATQRSSHQLNRGGDITPTHSFDKSGPSMKPSRSFEKCDVQTTQSHSFGRIDAPMTPSHSFGRGDAPMTPNHAFGRNDAPMTPSHQFDRSDTPANSSHSLASAESSHGFGRYDPRLNRTTEYEKQYNDRGRYQTDRYYDAEREYNRFARERGGGRNERDSPFNRGGRPYHKEYMQRLSRRDYEAERLYTRNRGYEEPFYNDINVEQEERRYEYRHQRSKNMGRPVLDDYQPRMERAPSMGRKTPSISRACAPNNGRNHNSETVSVKLPSVRSIDTRTTFNIDPKTQINDKFIDRKRRAASVGRTFARESSVGRYNDFNMRRQRATSVGRVLKQDADVFDLKNMSKKDYFHRACSVGRELSTSKKEKSWSEIKADFASYKFTESIQHKTAKMIYTPERCVKTKKMNYRDPRTRKNDKNKQNKSSSTTNQIQKVPYSPRSNSRDPRVQKDHENIIKNKGNNKHNKLEHSKEDNSHGIVYSSDNIARGKILGPGYGVKNYKIPKIKRPVEDINKEKQTNKLPLESENEDNDKKENLKNQVEEIIKDIKRNKSTVDKKSKIKREDTSSDVCSNSDTDTVSERITRLKNKSVLDSKPSEIKSQPRTRKCKKAVIESDSDEDEDKVVMCSQPSPKPSPKKTSIKKVPPVQDTVTFQNQEILDSSFTDDLEIFSESLVSDPVVNNIDDLIADLDNDLTNSNVNISFNETDNICRTAINPDPGENSLEELTDFLKEQINKSAEKTSDIITVEPVTESIEVKEPVTTTDVIIDINMENKCNTVESAYSANDFNDVTVSTSDISHEIKNIQIEQNKTPDSTVNASNKSEVTLPNDDRLPDSTNDIANENINFSSNLVIVPSNEEHDKPKHSIETPDLESIEHILTILQNKDRIKQLINMLGNQDHNETIKKKLTKLSEIVESVDDHKIENLENENNEKESTVHNLAEKSIEVTNSAETKTVSDDTSNSFSNEDMSTQEIDNIQAITEEVNKDKNELLDKQVSEDKNEILDSEISDRDTEPEDTVTKNISKIKNKKSTLKKHQPIKKGKSKTFVDKQLKTRVTRANTKNKTLKGEKKKTELQKLQEDLKEMFLNTDTPGIRMCRLAKMVGDKKTEEKDQPPVKENEPVVSDKPMKKKPGPKPKPKRAITDCTPLLSDKPKPPLAYKPGPKSKTKRSQNPEDSDPFAFDTDSTNDTSLITNEPKSDGSSDSEIESNASSSIASIEPIVELKKKIKRKRGRNWQSGIIKPKNRKNKSNVKQHTAELENLNNIENKYITDQQLADNEDIVAQQLADNTNMAAQQLTNNKDIAAQQLADKDIAAQQLADNKDIADQQWDISIPDLGCFTDTKYCFVKGVSKYQCRLCHYIGKDIVTHYKIDHPHSEVPLSRLHPDVAREAIAQCERANFQAISKLPINKYVCRFCFQEFRGTKNVLEKFFWHIASTHTGEYRQVCSECVNMTTCPMSLDIIPPPKDTDGQLIGYICEKCNYTQISLENLKHHVISRHDDQQTVVYTINLAVMTDEMIESLAQQCNQQITYKEQLPPSTLRTARSSVGLIKASDIRSDDNSNREIDTFSTLKSQVTRRTIQSKISFENDDNSVFSSSIKIEPKEKELLEKQLPCSSRNESPSENIEKSCQPVEQTTPNDIVKYPHFKIHFNDSGSKEYVCCINGTDNHYKTALLISMKKHIQIKHNEIWDGYCFICRAIVTPQGQHLFKDCFQHCLDRHIDSFPILEQPVENTQNINLSVTDTISHDSSITSDIQSDSYISTTTRPSINVRPLAELLHNDRQNADKLDLDTLPKIESVVSLGSPVIPIVSVVLPQTSPTFQFENEVPKIPFVPSKYEEAQSEIMSKKHRVVLEAMMSPEKLARLFKCAGRFCSFSTDKADEALLHASTHARVGGESALKCAYCDFDNAGNAIDLVTHVFKTHAICQFFCSRCFYRAGSSQLVGAHIERYHKQTVTAGSVLKSQFLAPTVPNDTSELLSRKIAVPFYVCNNGDPICNYKTYTPGKFTDHLILKHGNDSSFPCSMCEMTVASPIDLVKHLKTHGLMRYQCTWCIFGADNETDLLSHASEKHPSKQPHGYLRIITNKEGTNDYRVLPLANLNKCKVPFQEVTPSDVIENAVKEAERSVELEALIGSLITDPQHTTGPSQAESGKYLELDASGKSDDEVTETIYDDNPPQFITDQHATPIKSEVSETPVSLNLQAMPSVICLDSDDESSLNTPLKKPSQNLSTRVLQADLFKCPICKRQCRNKAGFAKHVLACSGQGKEVKCLHCPTFKTISIKVLVAHLQSEHSLETMHTCSICEKKFSTTVSVKKHMKFSHKVDEVLVKANSVKGYPQFLYTSVVPPQKAAETFRPQDVALLPINPIFDYEVKCAECEFSTKVRLNMVRHLQQHAQQQPAAATASVNPVPVSSERYFDKMLNLASSSISSQRSGAAALASRYPRYVAERQRRACGAPGCDYISVDDAMLRRHWDTLHPGATQYRCLHCPPTQQLDTSQPLTAARILAHLKMHDETLYACSDCVYHHYRRRVVDKHITEAHSGAAQLLVIREEAPPETPSPATSVAIAPAPTMDLKPWHCGICEFKSMLRQQVAEHCSKIHRSKMQYKCSYCPYRASTSVNVTKHQSNSHPQNISDIFYYYYKEGSIEDDSEDGTPRWVRQKQKMAVTETEFKPEMTNLNVPLEVSPTLTTTQRVRDNSKDPSVDLNIVKYEPRDEEPPQDLSTKFVQFCDPNGLKYKCPFCKIIMEDTREMMQTHLFEELKYRRWPCSNCSYKAFHKTGLNDHMTTEHRRANIKEPVALPINTEIESWVSSLLDYQSAVIARNRDKLTAQRIQTLPTDSTVSTKPKESFPDYKNLKDLEQTFGSIGSPVNMQFVCPKCQFTTKDDTVMQNHLENELNNIRWSCSSCSKKFVSYHEAQFHGKEHGEPARPLEVSREPRARAAWVQLVLDAQRRLLQAEPPATQPAAQPAAPDVIDNSLLTVRFEKSVPTPEEVSLARRKRSVPEDSDDEDRLLIDERPSLPSTSTTTTPSPSQSCPHCPFRTIHPLSLREHILRHYKLKPNKCGYCDFTGYRKQVVTHCHANHPSSPRFIVNVPIPDGPPLVLDINNKKFKARIIIEMPEQEKLLCLICDKIFGESEAKTHTHPNELQQFAKKNDVVVKCCRCTRLHKDVLAVQQHSVKYHPNDPVDYVYHKLTNLFREYLICSHCQNVFNTLKDLLSHHHLTHKNLLLNYSKYSVAPWTLSDNDTVAHKRKADHTLLPQAKRTARKSTSKLPKQAPVAKKSTTKLPQHAYDDSDTEEYTYYGSKPVSLNEYENITTMMPFCNTMMPFKMKQLRDIIQIEPLVLVSDCVKDNVPK